MRDTTLPVSLRTDPDAEIRERVDALNREASAMSRSDTAQAGALYEQARALALGLDPPYLAGLAESLLGLSFHSGRAGQYEPALTQSLEALSLYQRLADVAGQSRALHQIGLAYFWLSEYPLALDAQLQSLEFTRQIGDRKLQVNPLLAIGVINSEMGRARDALPYYDQALQICQDLGDTGQQARILNSYCVDSTNLGEYAQALDYGQRSLEIFTSVGNAYGQAVALGSIGEARLAAGQHDAALEALQRSLALVREANSGANSPEAVFISYQVGLAHMRRGDSAEALASLQGTLASAEQMQARLIAYQCHEQIATLHEQRGDPAQALHHYRQFHTIREQVFNEESDRKLSNLQVISRTREAIAEAQRQRQLREEDRRYFEQLTLLQKEFFNTATHDLRNPLLAIGLGIDMLELRAAPDDTDTHELLANMRHGARRMSQLISDILDLAKLETGRALRVEPTAAAPLLAAVVRDHQIAADQKQIHLTLRAELADAAISADAAQLRRALDNLIGNAIKYTPPGGRVTVLAEAAGELRIQVIDSGPGISAADLPHIFDHFYRVHQPSGPATEGTGLGLAIAKRIIEQHHGAVWVESALGSGSTFGLRLPLIAAPQAP